MKILGVSAVAAQDLGPLANTAADTLVKRQLRRPLLEAFDIHKSNISYGVISETEEEHAACMAWYLRLLDLDTDAIENPPACIQKHLERGGDH